MYVSKIAVSSSFLTSSPGNRLKKKMGQGGSRHICLSFLLVFLSDRQRTLLAVALNHGELAGPESGTSGLNCSYTFTLEIT